MANNNRVPSPVLSLPPLEYDVQYMDNLIRLLNYFIEQQGYPGSIRGTDLTLTLTGSGTVQPVASINYVVDPTSSLVNKTIVNIVNLPTSATGLSSGDVWNSAGTLKIV